MDPGTITIIYHNRGIIKLYNIIIITILMNGSGQKLMGVVKNNRRGQMSRFQFSKVGNYETHTCRPSQLILTIILLYLHCVPECPHNQNEALLPLFAIDQQR